MFYDDMRRALADLDEILRPLEAPAIDDAARATVVERLVEFRRNLPQEGPWLEIVQTVDLVRRELRLKVTKNVVDRIEARTDALRRLVDALEKEVVQTEQKRSLLDKETTGRLFEGFQAAVSARDAVRAGDADEAAVHIDSLIATLQTLISRLNPQPGAGD